MLIVDNDYRDVTLARLYLREVGICGAVAIIGDVNQAFVHLEECVVRRSALPQLIILDLEIEGGGGFELLNWICLQADLRRALVVVLCSSTDQHEVAKAAALGARTLSPHSSRLPRIRSAYQLVSAMWSIDELDRALNTSGVGRPRELQETCFP
ncbi:MAG: hypothetical protein Q8M65_01125, partial [Rhodoglobus sp.]|nr:hypothetical protein [Rhodoglobus sp.]